MSRIFIDRPVFAWVLAIIVMLAGALAIRALPIAQFPDVAPAQVTVRATYPGASAEAVENSVAQVIEQTFTGIDGLLYFSSTSNARGEVSITATFERGTDPDIAQVQVQNRLQEAMPRLPEVVQRQGVRVTKSNPDDLMILGVYDASDAMTDRDVADYMIANLRDPIGRVAGVGEVDVLGAPYAMRIWLDPNGLTSHRLTPADVIAAIRAQNTEIAAGEIGGQPQPDTQMLNVTVNARSLMTEPEQFRRIVLRSDRAGGIVRLADVARVELGSENYNVRTRINRHPATGMRIMLAPGADALETARLVRAEVDRLAAGFPAALEVMYANDTTRFVELSIREVVQTLIEAVVLVVIVMFVFLQSWRATLIPTIAVPVVLLGTFVVLWVAGFSINTLTLFGLVLAIGLLVDDAIVVVENVERVLRENPDMSPREATIVSMKEISAALVAIAIVLSAVFLPMSLFGGSTGVIYRQFAVTIIAAMVLSVLVALVLSPALTATLIKRAEPKDEGGERQTGRFRRFFGMFARIGAAIERRIDGATDRYHDAVAAVLRSKGIYMAIYGGVVIVLALLFVRLPTGYVPQEDQGRAIVQFRLPAGATQGRSEAVRAAVERHFTAREADAVASTFLMTGGAGAASAVGGQNIGQAWIDFRPWSERDPGEAGAGAIVGRATAALGSLRDAQVFAMQPPSIRGLGQFGGFSMELQNRGNLTRGDFVAARDRLLNAAESDPLLANVRLTELPPVPTLDVDVDQEALAAHGVNPADLDSTLSAAWGGVYVNDFVDRGRIKRVFAQGDAPYRARPGDLGEWHMRGEGGQMTSLAAVANVSWSQAPTAMFRFNGLPSFQIQGQPAPGVSSGQAMERMEELTHAIPGVAAEWVGLSYQERLSSGQASFLYALSLLIVFLCLAALYESWSVPVAVLLVIPLGLIGAVLAVTLRGLDNDVYFQIGILTTMGLAAKNAILIVEFAEQAERDGATIVEAALDAAKRRVRPIVMTSLAFIAGVLPLVVASGAGANSRIAIGTAVIGGMLTATILAIFYIPLFFVLVRTLARRGMRSWFGRTAGAEASR